MKKGDELTVDIVDLNSKGEGISRTDAGYVIFTEKSLPGDKVRVKLKRKKSSYATADLIELVKESEHRITPECSYFGICGGCKLQNYSYDKQLEYKTNVVRNAFERIGKFSGVLVPAALQSDDVFFYRNKMEFSFSDDKWLERKPDKQAANKMNENNFALGLHVPKFHSKIVDIEKCLLQSRISNDILNFIRNFFKERNVSIYSTRTHKGFLRFLIIRQSRNTDDILLNLVTHDYDKKLIDELSGKLQNLFPDITSFVNSISKRKAQVAFGEETRIIFGNGYIYEKLLRGDKEFKFKISPNSFFQTNTSQTEKLYSTALEFADSKETDNVLDLYCGAGTIAIYIADFVNKVVGVEILEDAVLNAEENADMNGIKNSKFVLSDIKDYFLKLKDAESKEDIYHGFNKLILDPPRSGLHPKLCEILSETNFEKIVYLSCNPVTQARDLELICKNGNYKLEKIQPVDMFPQTYHVENVVSLKPNKVC